MLIGNGAYYIACKLQIYWYNMHLVCQLQEFNTYGIKSILMYIIVTVQVLQSYNKEPKKPIFLVKNTFLLKILFFLVCSNINVMILTKAERGTAVKLLYIDVLIL